MYDNRFEMVRAIDTWSQHDVVVDPDEHLLLESQMNRIIPLYRQVVVCLYDLEQFGSAVIFNLLRLTRCCYWVGCSSKIPYYMTPDEVMTKPRQTQRDSDLLEKGDARCSAVTTGLIWRARLIGSIATSKSRRSSRPR